MLGISRGSLQVGVGVLLILLITIVSPSDAHAEAQTAVVIDAVTGRVLYSRNSDVQLYPASTTKVITALVTREQVYPGERVAVVPSAVGVEGSSIYLERGEVLTVEELLYGLLLESGNDAAHALAVYVSGGVDEFAALMTSRVRKAGATRTTLKNPHGLPNGEHVVTALELAQAARELLEYPLLQKIVATEEHRISWNNHDWQRRLYNHNSALGVEGIDGVKTGYTRSARHTYVASATRGGHQLIAVVLKTTRNGKYQEARTLLNRAFDTYDWVMPSGHMPGSIAVEAGVSDRVAVDVELPVVPVHEPQGEHAIAEASIYERVAAPVTKGQQLGEVTITVNEEIVGRVPIVASEAVGRKRTWWERWKQGVKEYLSRR